MARIIYYLLAIVILIITPFPPSVIATGTNSYIVSLKKACDAEAHYQWASSQQGKPTVRMNTDESQNSRSNNVLKTFSIGGARGYTGVLSDSWVQNVLSKRSDVESIEINGEVRISAPLKKRIPVPKEENPNKENPKEGDPKGEDPKGEDPKGEDPKGEDPKGEDPKGEDPKGEDPKEAPKDGFTATKTPLPNLDMMDTDGDPLFDNTITTPDQGGKGVNIFVVDTGVLVTHLGFGGRAKMAKVTCEGCPNTDDNGHGTHCAGIAAGLEVGVAKQANIFGIKVLDAKGAGNNADVIEGLQFVADQKQAKQNEIFVVNMSLGGKFNAAVNDAVKGLTDNGIHVFVAAGNDNEDACKSSPASEPSAITVGAVENDSLTITDFSNFGKCVDLFAPGRDIESLGIAADDQLAVFSGTSQATPHVAGAAALVLGKNGDMSPDALAKFMTGKALSGKMTFLEGTEDGSPNLFASINKFF